MTSTSKRRNLPSNLLTCPQLCPHPCRRSNFYSLYVRRNATVLYRGPEFAQYARQLTQSAQLYTYSGGAEAAQLLKHSAKLVDISDMLLSRRRQAQALPKTDPTYGLIRGDDESDEIFDWLKKTNELPHFSFSLVRSSLLAFCFAASEDVSDVDRSSCGAASTSGRSGKRSARPTSALTWWR